MSEFSRCYERKTGGSFDAKERQIRYGHLSRCVDFSSPSHRCLAHIINLATQALISTRSKAKYYNPHNVDEHTPDTDAWERDELGLVRAISVKGRSSSQRKELFRTLQTRKGIDQPVQLLIDMKVRWGSTYVMLNRANSNKKVITFCQFVRCSWIMLTST